MARLIPDKTAASTRDAEIAMYSPLPPRARIDQSWDNGTESALHQEADDLLGMTTYYADSYSSWQRGSNKNRNGQIRRYLHKGTPLEDVTGEELSPSWTRSTTAP